MNFGSLFSGIEAASCAWLPLGWRCAWVAEIDPFACAVLRHHYPDTPNLGDVEHIVPYRGKPATDGPRYRAIGNSMAVPVVRWIGERIRLFERGGGFRDEPINCGARR